MSPKSIGLLFGAVLSICGCSSTPQSKTVAYDQRDYTEIPDHCKNDTNPNVQLTPTKEVPVSPRTVSVWQEEQNYLHSLSNIQQQFRDEELQLEICWQVHSDDGYCRALLKSLCKVDEHLDSRGAIHRKPYCFNR